MARFCAENAFKLQPTKQPTVVSRRLWRDPDAPAIPLCPGALQTPLHLQDISHTRTRTYRMWRKW